MPTHESSEVGSSTPDLHATSTEKISADELASNEQPLALETLPKRRPGLTVERVDKKVAAIFSIVGKVFIAGVIMLVIVFIVRQLSNTGYAIQHVNMPVSFQEAGYTGPVIADRIISNLKAIIDRVKVNSVEFIDPALQADVSVDLVGVGVPVRAAIGMVGEAIGLERNKTIATDFTIDGDTLIVRISFTGETPEQFKFQMKDGKEAVLRKAIDQVSFSILKYAAPDILGLYYSTHGNDPMPIIDLAKFTLQRHTGDPYYEARAYAYWAGALVNQGKLEAAGQMIAEGLRKFPGTSSLYNVKAALSIAKSDPMDSVLAADKKCLMFGTTLRSKATACSNIGYDFTMLRQSDSAIFYYKEAIGYDPEFATAYYNIGINYLLLKADTAQFLEYFEEALTKHVPRKTIMSDRDIQGMLSHARVKALLERYAE